jgi:hypothetical protein
VARRLLRGLRTYLKDTPRATNRFTLNTSLKDKWGRLHRQTDE